MKPHLSRNSKAPWFHRIRLEDPINNSAVLKSRKKSDTTKDPTFLDPTIWIESQLWLFSHFSIAISAPFDSSKWLYFSKLVLTYDLQAVTLRQEIMFLHDPTDEMVYSGVPKGV